MQNSSSWLPTPQHARRLHRLRVLPPLPDVVLACGCARHGRGTQLPSRNPASGCIPPPSPAHSRAGRGATYSALLEIFIDGQMGHTRGGTAHCGSGRATRHETGPPSWVGFGTFLGGPRSDVDSRRRVAPVHSPFFILSKATLLEFGTYWRSAYQAQSIHERPGYRHGRQIRPKRSVSGMTVFG